jgi:hypothetical protein
VIQGYVFCRALARQISYIYVLEVSIFCAWGICCLLRISSAEYNP